MLQVTLCYTKDVTSLDIVAHEDKNKIAIITMTQKAKGRRKHPPFCL